MVEMPAGLVDEGEEGVAGSTRAALRELQEETGYGGLESQDKGDSASIDDGRGELKVLETSEIMVNDPGMTGANMRLCVVKIDVKADAPEPVAQPEEGEFIEKHLFPLKGLYKSLQGALNGRKQGSNQSPELICCFSIRQICKRRTTRWTRD